MKQKNSNDVSESSLPIDDKSESTKSEIILSLNDINVCDETSSLKDKNRGISCNINNGFTQDKFKNDNINIQNENLHFKLDDSSKIADNEEKNMEHKKIPVEDRVSKKSNPIKENDHHLINKNTKFVVDETLETRIQQNGTYNIDLNKSHSYLKVKNDKKVNIEDLNENIVDRDVTVQRIVAKLNETLIEYTTTHNNRNNTQKILPNQNVENIVKMAENIVLEQEKASLKKESDIVEVPDYEDEKSPKCKICFLHNNPINGLPDLIAPCGCKGSIKYVHSTCLKLWRFKGKNIREIKRCEQCFCDYTIGGEHKPNRFIVVFTNVTIISFAFLISNVLMQNLQEAVFFLMDDALEEEWRPPMKIYVNDKQKDVSENFWKTKRGMQKIILKKEVKNDRNTESNPIHSEDKKLNGKKCEEGLYNNKNTNDWYRTRDKKSGSNYFSNLSIDYEYGDLDTDWDPVSLYTSSIVLLLIYSFFSTWNFWSVFNFYFTSWRYYQFGFIFDKYLLFGFTLYYTSRMYKDLYLHVDTFYVFAFNYRN